MLNCWVCIVNTQTTRLGARKITKFTNSDDKYLGSTPEEQALVSQWLEWADVQHNGSRNIENFLEVYINKKSITSIAIAEYVK